MADTIKLPPAVLVRSVALNQAVSLEMRKVRERVEGDMKRLLRTDKENAAVHLSAEGLTDHFGSVRQGGGKSVMA